MELLHYCAIITHYPACTKVRTISNIRIYAYSELYGHNDERRAVSTWETFSLQSKLLLCDLWNVPTLLGSFLSLVFACLSIRDGVLPSKGEEVVLGVSAMLYWFGLLGIC